MSHTSGQACFADGVSALSGTGFERFHAGVERVWICMLEYAPGQDCIINGFGAGQMPSVADGAMVCAFLCVFRIASSFDDGQRELGFLLVGVTHFVSVESAFTCGLVLLLLRIEMVVSFPTVFYVNTPSITQLVKKTNQPPRKPAVNDDEGSFSHSLLLSACPAQP